MLHIRAVLARLNLLSLFRLPLRVWAGKHGFHHFHQEAKDTTIAAGFGCCGGLRRASVRPRPAGGNN